MEVRICAKCDISKNLEDFPKQGGRICKACKIVSTLEWRARNPEAPRKHAKAWYLKNKEAAAKIKKSWRAANIEHVKDCDRKRHVNHREKRNAYNRNYQKTKHRFMQYGITKDLFDKLLASQNYECPICSASLLEKNHIDHDHNCCPKLPACGSCIRGIVCGLCNKGLGHLKESSTILRRAATYLDNYNNLQQP